MTTNIANLSTQDKLIRTYARLVPIHDRMPSSPEQCRISYELSDLYNAIGLTYDEIMSRALVLALDDAH